MKCVKAASKTRQAGWLGATLPIIEHGILSKGGCHALHRKLKRLVMLYDAAVRKNCGELVPYPLPPGTTLWHPHIPRTAAQYMASIEGV